VRARVRQLEDAAGTTLLSVSTDGTLTLTADGKQFARDVTPVLNMLAEPAHETWTDEGPRRERHGAADGRRPLAASAA
jgi:DNA-binding transcriptional LysR family regulator